MGVINKTTEAINTLLEKVENMPSEGVEGKTPVLETGTTTTLDAGSQATSEVVRDGEDEDGNPKYRLNFGIPKGYDGSSSGGGGVAESVQWSNVLNKPSWVNSATKPTYTATEVGALPATTVIPSKTSQLTNDSNFTTTSSFKTINGETVIGSGNIEISGSGSGIADAPSDGNVYGRKDGNWEKVSSIIVDVTDIFNRLYQSSEVGGNISQEDYNKLAEYISSGYNMIASQDGTTYKIESIAVSGELSLEIKIPQPPYSNMYMNFIIKSDLTISMSNGYYLNDKYIGALGKLTDYRKPDTYSAIQPTDTINTAIGKLEAGLESAGGGSSDEFVIYGTNIVMISPTDTSEQLISYLGGVDNLQNIRDAATNNKKILFTYSGLAGYTIIANSNVVLTSLYLSFTLPKGMGTDEEPKNVCLKIINNVTITHFSYLNGYELNSGIANLTESSTSDDIKAVLPFSEIQKIEKLNNFGCSFFIKPSSNNNARTTIFLTVINVSNTYLIGMKSPVVNIFPGTSDSISIIYNTTDDKYSVSK